MKRPSGLPLLVIVIALVGLGALALAYQNMSDSVAGLPPDRAPTTPSSPQTPGTPAECESAGGIWNTCASACPNASTQPCIQVCVARCEGLEGTGSVRAYFTNHAYDASTDACASAYPVNRQVTRGSDGYPEAALRELLKGPTADELSAGYATTIPQGVELKSLTITSGTAHADFSATLGRVAGSCAVRSIRAQIDDTLHQFSGIKNILISVEGGNPAEALQP